MDQCTFAYGWSAGYNYIERMHSIDEENVIVRVHSYISFSIYTWIFFLVEKWYTNRKWIIYSKIHNEKHEKWDNSLWSPCWYCLIDLLNSSRYNFDGKTKMTKSSIDGRNDTKYPMR